MRFFAYLTGGSAEGCCLMWRATPLSGGFIIQLPVEVPAFRSLQRQIERASVCTPLR